MANDNEPRALGAALAAPAFVTRGHGMALHAANRHVERWAPEANAGRVRSMRSLGFVDRLVAPWMETAQRSASLRLFTQYADTGASERQGSAVSWVFPRPWYQDELDWMAAARQASVRAAEPVSPSLLTTRGTYVTPVTPVPSARAEIAAPQVVMPSALYEYVAPSLSIAASQPAPIPGVGFGGETRSREAYSPLISLAAVQAADLMTRTVGSLAAPRTGATAGAPGRPAPGALSPGLRSVLTSILQRAATPPAHELPTTRHALSAPELVTPPAPSRADELREASAASAVQVAEQYAEQRARVVELQRIAQSAQPAQRELAARADAMRAGDLAARGAAPVPTSPAGAPAAPADTRVADAARATSDAARTTSDAARATAAAELRAVAERAERELRQRAGEARVADLARQAEAASADAAERARIADAAERARIEERIAQRVTERTAAQRLHEQARAAAASDARTGVEPVRRPEVAATPGPSTIEHRVPAEVTTAVAGLPPALAAILGPAVALRPDRARQVIDELNETLRTVELLARSSAAGTAFEPTRGPRLMMPAGLGGLVSAVDRAQSIGERPALLGGVRPLAPLAQFVEPEVGAPRSAPALASLGALRIAAAARDVRVPTLAWLSAPATRSTQSIAPVTALGATSAAAPAALSHVAWADRWLARFAGATPQSLDVISAAAASAPAVRMQALASAAPDAVFVAPDFAAGRGELSAELPRGPASAPSIGSPASPYAAAAAADRTAGIAAMRLINPPPSEPVRRFDDEAETPDDVFAAISAAASRGRGASSRPATAAPGAASAQVAAAASPGAGRATFADVVAHSAPSAPGAGLSAQLASSPFAPALRHVLMLPSAPSFDVRSLFGAGLGVTYLAGLLGAASHELEIGAQMAPTWASWSEAPLAQQLAADRVDRVVPEFEAAYVSADEIARFEEIGRFEEIAGEPGAAPARAAAAIGDASAPATALPAALDSAAATSWPAARSVAALASEAPLTTLRSALLSWDVVATGEPGAGDPAQTLQLAPTSFAAAMPTGAGVPASYAGAGSSLATARMMLDAMSLPMLADVAQDRAVDWAAPGMIAGRAHAWSVAQERSAADLALDFVAPELVLAARVYGLGPAEAAQAARLAIAGPGQLGAMASTVDRTFVEAMAIGREAREARNDAELRRPARAAIGEAGEVGEVTREVIRAGSRPTPAAAAITTAFPTAEGDIAAAIAPPSAAAGRGFAGQPVGTAFGVDRRVPRGAFLWPSATVAALGMTAAGSDGATSISVAALELLAARAVAELGTFTVMSEADAVARGGYDTGELASAAELAAQGGLGEAADRASAPGSTRIAGAVADAGRADALPSELAGRAAAEGVGSPALARRDAGQVAQVEPGEADVLGAAAAFIPASRRARFEALYVALGQSTAGRQWSPAARAARALALAGRGEEPALSPRERAASAWDVLPVVYASDTAASAAMADAAATGEAGAGIGAAAAADLMSSYVAPSGAPGAPGQPGAPGSASQGVGARAAGAGGRGRGGSPGAFVDPGVDESETYEAAYVAPGLGRLSARAGEALGSYVTAAPPPSAPREERSDLGSLGAVMRPPTAAPEYVHTGRSTGRYGGGEVEIPPWFEAAARKMLAEQSGSGDGISLAELTLVTAAPASQIAAAPRAQPSASPAGSGPGGTDGQNANTPKIDLEKLANELYRDIMVLMDVARARNGDPYL